MRLSVVEGRLQTRQFLPTGDCRPYVPFVYFNPQTPPSEVLTRYQSAARPQERIINPFTSLRAVGDELPQKFHRLHCRVQFRFGRLRAEENAFCFSVSEEFSGFSKLIGDA